MNLSDDVLRMACASLLLLAYAGMCVAIWRRTVAQARAEHAQAARLVPAREGAVPIVVVHASQTGQAESLAWHTAELLHTAGEAVQVISMRLITTELLKSSERILFVVSTYGEGDPPDTAAGFVSGAMAIDSLDLSRLQYAVMALGDKSYVNFCGFGRTLDTWLRSRGATPFFARVEVDSGDNTAITQWQHQLGHVASLGDLPVWQDAAWQQWTLQQRDLLNAGSEGQPVFHIELSPPEGVAADWQSGDLIQVSAPAEPDRPREYSIGSIADDGRVHLLVRREMRADGTPGIASGWLTEGAAIGANIQLRIRAHSNFRLEENAQRPLVLIGNGTGLAGLRSHLKAREAAGQRDNWLVFGERKSSTDFLYRNDIERWKASRVLARLDMVFSRDQAEKKYVQDRLREEAELLRSWLARGAAVYVCGSLEGMAGGVDDALRQIAGDAAVDDLAATGRYRRDVY